LIFLLGTIIGSFLNVVIYRFNTGKSITKGRSICMSCNKTLRWYELIPIFSFLIQSGRCRRCASSISHQYPLVELITGIIFVLLSWHFLPLLLVSYSYFIYSLVLYSFLFSLLIVISFYDIHHKIIPNTLVYLFGLISFLSIFVFYTQGGFTIAIPSLFAIFSGPIFALPFVFLWFVSKGKWMGLGDAKLILGIGWLLGYATFSSLVLSFWVGAIIGLILLIPPSGNKSRVNMKTEIPFAPFLVLGLFITVLFNLNILLLLSF